VKSKYKSSKSVAKNQTVPISVDDPRVAWDKVGQTKARQGAEIDIVGLDGKSLSAGGRGLSNPTGTSGVNRSTNPTDIILPPINNEPPSVYPGGSGATVIIPTSPSSVTAAWSGEDLVVQFSWEHDNDLNKTISQFILELTADGITRRTPLNTFLPNKTQSIQAAILTKSLNRLTFGVFRTSITAVCVIAADPFNNVSQSACAATVPAYVLDLPTPVINATAISNGYSISYTTPTQSSYDAVDVWEIEDSGTTAPAIVYAADGVTPTNYKRTYFSNINPANVITENYNKRWVIARFSSSGGAFTPFSSAQTVTPTSPVSIDNTPPNEASQISASWSGDNIVITYTLPSQDPGSRIQIELTAPNSLLGFFYRFPDGTGTSQTATITKRDLFDQFGEHYSSFTGILRSIDGADNRTSGVSFNVPVRSNPLATVIPTFTLTPLTNGYSVFATNYATTVGINYMEVYAKHTPWVGDPENDDYVVYAGVSPAVIIDEDYTTVYVKIRYYDDFTNNSLYSIEDTVVPMGPGDITSFETPITFGTNGVIYAGGDYQSGHRTVFKSSGLFAYDASSTSTSTGLTTQIVSNASTGTPTFITTRAQIADWNITDTKIENDLSGTPTKYTGLSATGPYSFWAGSDISGGDSSSKFTVTPTGEVTAREISIIGNGDPLSNLISAGGLFTVKNDGSFTATGADIQGRITADSGEFTGNIQLNGGSLYALGAGGTVSSGIRTVFNSSGVSAYNASGGYAQMLTTPLADGSVFATTAATIGGWEVDSSKIKKTSISGKGNIILDSSNGYIAVSNSNISSSLAGINSPGNNLGNSVFWAGGTDPNDVGNPFRVTLGGTLHATGANITGTVSSIGALGKMTMDGTDGYMSLQTAGSGGVLGPASFLVPRNNNIYLTSPSATEPWSTGKEIATDGPTNGPYFSAGSSFKDYLGSTVNGIGIFSGPWNYFGAASGTVANSASKPFVTATTTGVQISANAQVGMIVASTSSALAPAIPNNTPGILIYTSKQETAPYSPSTTFGAWAAFTPNKINLSASTNTFIDIDAAVPINGGGVTSRIVIQASPFVVAASIGDRFFASGASAYGGASRIVMDPTFGVVITGVQVQKDADMTDYGAGGSYKNTAPLGRYPRQRMLVEDPVTGEVMLGMAVYYRSASTGGQTGVPTDDTGYAGDLLVQY
jgi:hypothetical protein